ATMRIEQALAGCRALHDLPALIDALGGEPRYAELSPLAWLGAAAERAGVRAAAEIGRLDALPCIGVLADDPKRAAERILASTSHRGAPVFLVTLGARSLDLTIGAGIDPPRILRVDPDAPDGAALASLRRLSGALGGGRTATAIRLGDRLAAQRVDGRFFTAFRDARDRLAAEGPLRASPAERSALALLQLTRVLFLYFIQRKGWLDGRNDFLSRAVDAELTRGRSLAGHLLRPLFFGLLNRPPGERSAASRRIGTVPFLNGGLFEPHPLERRWRFDHSNDAWRQAFDQLFEHFHFTLDERGDGTSVAPDMLGRVFEGLMLSDERRATGTFYTPARIVDRIVAAGVASFLAERLGIEIDDAEARLRGNDEAVLPPLAACRVLDPAVGSGAFLLGALELFTRISRAHDPAPGIRREILRRQLFGIDLSAEAVRLAELRLWLAAVQDDPDGGIDRVEPLPNLDATLRQGDTLKDPRWLAGLRRTPRVTARQLADARTAFIRESGAGKRAAWRRLRDAERAAASEALAEGTRDLEGRIDTLLADARAPDLFGKPRGLGQEGRRALRAAREDRRYLRDAARRLRREGSLPWFDAQSCFGEVFATRGGFDLVVGNPPWVRGEEVPARDRMTYAERYRWWRGNGARGFGHRPDLSVAFLERSFELCAPGGAVAMLLPTKLATAGYGAALRAHLSARTTLDR
ncbi:MAG TPA: N-6 DNA methylase, partial [Gemmatimonadales bacterium]|nr:N-6 DNA methylase [Gemmatimonadales bacterium]